MPDTKPPPPEPKTSHTEWTSCGHRLLLIVWPDILSITVETEGASTDGGRFTFMLGRIVIVEGSLRSHAHGFVRHSLGFYSDEPLVQEGLKAIENFFESKSKPSEKARPISSDAN